MIEQGIVFDCRGDDLVGVVSLPARPCDTGVLIVVGGPQYRAGSHRQFVLLARRLAVDGFPAMRFDLRGMGDSAGDPRTFEEVSDDIAAAVAAFRQACRSVHKVVLWGLCDGASAALLYVDDHADIDGLALVNPWVRSEQTLAKARVKYYYSARLFDRDFWKKLLRGKVLLGEGLHGVLRAVREAGDRRRDEDSRRTFVERMRSGMTRFGAPVLFVLSGRDLTAREFEEMARADETWRRLLTRPGVEQYRVEDADHTFSSVRARDRVESMTLDWLRRCIARDVT
jgi:exosortase A-associated hydrolase 1